MGGLAIVGERRSRGRRRGPAAPMLLSKSDVLDRAGQIERVLSLTRLALEVADAAPHPPPPTCCTGSPGTQAVRWSGRADGRPGPDGNGDSAGLNVMKGPSAGHTRQ